MQSKRRTRSRIVCVQLADMQEYLQCDGGVARESPKPNPYVDSPRIRFFIYRFLEESSDSNLHFFDSYRVRVLSIPSGLESFENRGFDMPIPIG